MNPFGAFLICSLLSCSALLFPPCPSAAEQATGEQVQVTVAPVIRQNVPSLIEVVGTIQAAERATIAAKVTGVITDIPVVLGSRVNGGDLLVAISAEEISARVNQADAQRQQAKRNLDRERKLLKKNATTSETVKSMEDRYNVARAAFEEAKTMLGYTRISAPFPGVITKKSAQPGDLATPGMPLLHIENDQHLQVSTSVPASLVLDIHPGDRLQLKVPAADILAEGVVAEVAPSADPASRTAPVTIDLPANRNLRTGQFSRVMLPGKEQQSLFIPQSAVIAWGQMDRVFVAENGLARLRLVRIGMHHNGMVEILSGLEPGEQVITSNNALLLNGQPLQIRP